MKLKNFSIIAACMTLLASCSDDPLVKPIPVVPGSQVSFSVITENNNSRTYYAYPENAGGIGSGVTDDKTTSWKLFWTNGDRVNIVSPNLGSSASTYKITVPAASADNPGSNQATDITTIDAHGIQWGDVTPTEEMPVRFYSVFPASYKISFGELGETVTNEMSKSSDAPAQTATASADLHIRRNQIIMFTAGDTHPDARIGMPIDRASNTNPEACQNNPDAIMYAQTMQTTGGNVQLKYVPLSTVLHVVIEDITGGSNQTGVATGTRQDSAFVYGFRLTAPETVQLAGDFKAVFDINCENEPTITRSPKTGDNEIYITTLDDISGRYMSVTTNDIRKVEFNVFIVPQDNLDINGWTLEIETDYGDYTTTLTSGNENGGVLKKGQIQYMPLSTIKLSDHPYELQPESWLSEIPDNVYATELTLPGAWYCTTEDYQGSGVTVESLYNAGVRAFSLETRTSRTNTSTTIIPNYTPSSIVVSGTQDQAGNYGTGGTAINTVIQSILQQVVNTPQEFSVLVLSYADGGDYAQNDTDHNYWVEGLENEINTALDKTYTPTSGGVAKSGKDLVFGYNDGMTLTPQTTVGDLRGKLLIKINMDDRFKAAYNQNINAVFAQTSYKWVKQVGGINTNYTPLMSHGYWNSWSPYVSDAEPGYAQNIEFDWSNIDDMLMSHQDGVHFAYTNANRTYHIDEGSTDTIPPSSVDIATSYERERSIATLVNTSDSIYNVGAHNVWFQIGAGGVRAENSTDKTLPNAGKHIAVHLNQFFYNLINAKINRNCPSPLGLVLCNFITQNVEVTDDTGWRWGYLGQILVGGGTIGGTYENSFDGTKLIKVIMQMNNEFYLQRDPNWVPSSGSGSGTTTQSVKSASPNHSSGFSAPSGSWEAI